MSLLQALPQEREQQERLPVTAQPQQVAKAHDIVGIDLVEVAPDYDHSQSTAILAAQVLLNFLGFIFHARGAR